MADTLDVLGFSGGVLAVLLGLFLILRGVRSPARWVLGGLLVDFGLVTALELYPSLLGSYRWSAPGSVTIFALRGFFVSFNLAFAVVFPQLSLSPTRRLLLALAFLPSLLIAFYAFANPGEARLDPPSGFGRFVRLLTVASHFPALWAFGQYWLTTGTSQYRSQFLYVLVPYLLWNVTDAIHSIVVTFLHPDLYGALLLGTAFMLSLLQFVAVFVIGLGSLIRAAAADRDVWREDLRLVLLLVLTLPLAILLFIGRSGPYLVDALIVPILFYGGARFQVPEFYLTIKSGLVLSILGAVGAGVLLLVEEVIQFYFANQFGDQLGFIGGLTVALLTVLAFAPLRRAARRVSNRLLPGVEGTDAYLAERRLQLYRVALEGVIRDRHVNPNEAKALAGLRTQLRITWQEHQALERAIAGGGGTPIVQRAQRLRV